MILHNVIERILKEKNIRLEEFSEVLIRLMDYGVICRDESQIEETLYDRYLQVHELIEEYLALMGVRLQHDQRFCSVRAFPPGAVVPGMPDDDNQGINSGLRARLSQNEVAMLLVLRAEYEKSLREGLIDEHGSVTVSLESIAIALQNLLKRSLPETLTERKSVFKRLRQLRLIQYNVDDELDSEESWVRIRPGITSFVTDTVLQQLSSGLEEAAMANGSESKDTAVASTLFDGEDA